MKLETMLDIQSSADGELSAYRQVEVARLLATDPEARQLHAQISSLRGVLRDHPSGLRVEDSRDFYWSQIHRRIQAEERVKERAEAAGMAMHVWRWLAPMMGVSAVIAVVALQPFMGGKEMSGSANQVTTVTFSSETDGVTIHWIN